MSRYLLFIFILFSTQTLFSQETKYVNTELLNVRSGPGKNYEVLDTAPKGEKVNILSVKGNWTHIQLDSGIRGFVSSKFLSTDIPSSEKTNSETGTWWKAILGTVGFLFLVKIFSGKKSSSTSSRDYSNPDTTKQNVPSISVTKKSNTPLKEKSQTSAQDYQLKEKFYCKFCGTEDNSLYFLTSRKCGKSSSGFHMPFEGVKENKYLCKFCGSEEKSLYFLTSRKCVKSSNDYHQPFDGGIRNSYACKFCGTTDKSLYFLTSRKCNKSTNEYHQPVI